MARRKKRRNAKTITFKTRRGKTVRITNIGRGKRRTAWNRAFTTVSHACKGKRAKAFRACMSKGLKKKSRSR